MLAASNESSKITVDFTSSVGLSDFLTSHRISIAVSTYQSGNLFLIGPAPNDALHVKSVVLERPMGLCVSGDSLFVGGLYQVYRFNNVLPPGVRHEGADKLYTPTVSWTIGEVDCHDLTVESSGRIVFVNTMHSCLATVSLEESFIPLWKPPCISKLEPEDRCHLNGLALRDGKVRYATAFSRTDTSSGWREDKDHKGVVWDITTNQVVVENLSMPHSPRWHEERLWLLDSGSGSLGFADLAQEFFTPVLKIPGYLRGLTFQGSYAFVGSSVPRDKSSIEDARVLAQLAAEKREAYCGLFIVDLQSGELVHWIRITGDIQEIFDIAVIPNVQAADGIGLRDERIKYVLKLGQEPSEGTRSTQARISR